MADVEKPQVVALNIDADEDEQESHTDSEELEDRSCSSSEIKERGSSVSEVDLESGTKLHLAKAETDCRICHLSLDEANQESGLPIELGCSCKDDLAAAHKHCAETWFKIKGNKVCEICGSVARNVSGANEAEMIDQWNEPSDAASAAQASALVQPVESRHFWQSHRFLNFLLACMLFAFIISWLFHFNVPS